MTPVDFSYVFSDTDYMAGRNLVFANGEYYHIYNRGIARQPVFFTKRDYERFLLTLDYYRYTDIQVKLSRYLYLSADAQNAFLLQRQQRNDTKIEIVSCVLMSNHFHLLVRQKEDNAITRFMSKIINSYTRYINTKRERVGDLFQGVFKAVHIETDEQLIHLSRYIHVNPVVSFVVRREELPVYPWSSFPDYQKGASDLFEMKTVLSQFKSPKEYTRFVLDQIEYGKKLEEIKHLVLEK